MMGSSVLAALAVAGLGAIDPDGGTEVVDIADVSLESLLETPITIASATGTARSTAESPGIVTVITREEIRDLGARDLIDILRFVPGFDFSNDIENAVGLTVRGIWALEGKALVTIDGMPYNDLAYGNVLFGNRAAVDLIERVEIIRGPGSTIYGGFAELAVINVVTHPDKPVDRVIASTTYGQMPTAPGRANVSVLASHSFGDLHVRASAFTGLAIRSDRTVVNAGETVSMTDTTRIRPANLSLGLDWKELSAQLIYDDYYLQTYIPESPQTPLDNFHKNLFASLKWVHPFNDFVTLNLQARYQHQSTWESTSQLALDNGYYADKRIDRVNLTASVLITPRYWLQILAGGAFNFDHGQAVQNDDPAIIDANTYYDTEGNAVPSLTFLNATGFVEASAFTQIVNVTAGARFDWHSVYGPSFVPRIALTKEIGGFHAKALFSRAFRAPVFENISYFPAIKPETTTVIELEAGYQFAPWLYLGVNAFDNRVYGTIVYQEDGASVTYVNAGTTGTHGLEIEARSRGNWGYVKLGYSFYEATVRGVEQYLVEGRPDLHLGAPAHKLTARASLRLGEHFAINPALIIYSERYGLEQPLGASEPVLTRFEPTALFDLFAVVRSAGTDGLDLSFGVHDAFGSSYRYVPAYNAGTNAMPGPSTEVMIRLTYLHDFGER